MSRYLAIVNSRIRKPRRQMVLAQLRAARIDIAETAAPGHAIELARESHSYDGILAVGGDGTLHEVLNGMDRARQCAGILPAGTINGIARYVGLGQSGDLSDWLKTGVIQSVDVIDAEYGDATGATRRQLFAGFLALGHTGSSLRIARVLQPLPFGIRIVAATTLHTLIQRAKRCTITVDDTDSGKKKITSLVINNCIAEIFSSIKSWDMQDGTLEVQAARRWIPGQVMNNFVPAFRFLPDPAGWMAGVKKIDASFSRPVDMIGDGELFTGIVHLQARVIPGGLRMLASKNGRFAYGLRS